MANSSYYGMGKKVDSILRAITIIGFDEILGMAIGIGILPSFKNNPIGRFLDMRQLWLHSLGCCFAVRNSFIYLQRKANGEAAGQLEEKATFLPILLHDMGKIILSVYFPEEYAQVLQFAAEQELPLQRVELEMLGIDHANLSALLMQYWNFPETIIVPVRFHHAPGDCVADFRFGAKLIMFANGIVREASIGNSSNPQSYSLLDIGETLGFENDELQEMKTTLTTQKGEIEQFLQLIS